MIISLMLAIGFVSNQIFSMDLKKINNEKGIYLLKNLELSLKYKDYQNQKKQLEKLKQFMGDNNYYLDECFRKEFNKVVLIKPSLASMPIDLTYGEIEENRIILSPTEFKVLYSEKQNRHVNFTNPSNMEQETSSCENLPTKKKSIERSTSQKFIASFSGKKEQPKRTTSETKVNEIFKKSELGLPPQNISKKTDSTDKQPCEVITNPIFITWLKSAKEHENYVRKEFNELAKIYYDTTLHDIQKLQNTLSTIEFLSEAIKKQKKDLEKLNKLIVQKKEKDLNIQNELERVKEVQKNIEKFEELLKNTKYQK